MNIEPTTPTVKNPPEQFAGDVWGHVIAVPHESDHVEGTHHRRRIPRPHRKGPQLMTEHQSPAQQLLGQRNGLTDTEIVEAITHLAFYTGWPHAMSAITTARATLTGGDDTEGERR